MKLGSLRHTITSFGVKPAFLDRNVIASQFSDDSKTRSRVVSLQGKSSSLSGK